MECSKCQCQDGEYKSGISKKNGKPWRGWKCSSCGEMTFLKDSGAVSCIKTSQENPLVKLIERNNELLVKILSALSKEVELEKEELKPDEDTPF